MTTDVGLVDGWPVTMGDLLADGSLVTMGARFRNSADPVNIDGLAVVAGEMTIATWRDHGFPLVAAVLATVAGGLVLRGHGGKWVCRWKMGALVENVGGLPELFP